MKYSFDQWIKLREFHEERNVTEIHGEYWINESGQALFADGDIGDYNHAAYVLETLQYEVAETFGIYNHEGITPEDEFFKQIIEKIIEEAPELEQTINQLKKKNQVEKIVIQKLKESGYSDKLANDMVYTLLGFMDPRDFAIIHWGWKRVLDNMVETYTLTPNDMKTIANGLYDIEPQLSPQAVFTIEIVSNRKVIDLTLEELEQGRFKSEQEKQREEEWKKQASQKQIEDQEKKNLPDYYKNKPFPFSEQRNIQ